VFACSSAYGSKFCEDQGKSYTKYQTYQSKLEFEHKGKLQTKYIGV